MSRPADSTPLISAGGYSARVRLHLCVNGTLIPLAQVDYDRMILEEPVEIAPGPGELVIDVDDATDRYDVEIGCTAPGSRQVPIRLIR